MIQEIDARLTRLTGYPASFGDAFEIRRYHFGAVYDFHLDTPNGIMRGSPNRTLSLVMYCTPEVDYDAERMNTSGVHSGDLIFPIAALDRHVAAKIQQGQEPPADFPAGAPIVLSLSVREACSDVRRAEATDAYLAHA